MGRVVLERFLSEPFLRNCSIFLRFFKENPVRNVGHAHPACVHTDSKACNAFLHDDAQCKFPDATDEYTKMQAIIATLKANQNRIDNFLKDTNHMLGVV